jgi:hypothetical protein
MDQKWKTKMGEICEELRVRGITAFPSHETRSCLLVRTSDIADQDHAFDWAHMFTAPEVSISDDDLDSEHYMEIVLRKVTAALGYMPLS